MEWGTFISSTILNLSVTVLAYLLVPMIVLFTGKKYPAKKLKRINIFNCILVWMVFRIIRIQLTGEPGTGASVFLWGAVGHWILKKYCIKETQPEPIQPSQATEQTFRARVCLSDKDESTCTYGNYNVSGSEIKLKLDVEQPTQTHPSVVKQTVKYCSRCGKVVDPVTKKCRSCGKQYFKGISFKAVLAVMLCILFMVSFTGNVLLFFTSVNLRKETDVLEKSNTSLKSEVVELSEKIADLKTENSELQGELRTYAAEISFIDEYVVFIEDDGTNLYHKYECSKFKAEEFWVFNIDAAENDGYIPCSRCCS